MVATFALVTEAIAIIKFSYALNVPSSVTSPSGTITLSINSLGAKSLNLRNLDSHPDTILLGTDNAGILFLYNGSSYRYLFNDKYDLHDDYDDGG